MRQWLFPAAIGLFVGILAMWVLRDDPEARTNGLLGPAGAATPAEPPEVPADPAFAVLREVLAQEIEAREWLSEEVGWLRAEVSRLEEAGRRHELEPADPDLHARVRADVLTETAPSEETASARAADPRRGPDRSDQRLAFDTDLLVVAGFEPEEALRLRDRWSDYEMERLDLAHQAVREGWLMTRRHRRERRTLEQELRGELGDERYDLLLYATDQPNRLIVQEVIDRSPASEAGFEPGDEILTYDGGRIFRRGELLVASAGGEMGEYISVEVVRAGETEIIHVPRGPMGLLLDSDSRPPLER